jgi:hypothetical protein
MSIRIMSMIWEVQFPTQSQLLIALKMADFANDEGGSIYPSRSRLADQAQCSESTVKNTLKVFREIGLLKVIREGGKGPKNTTEYELNLRLVNALVTGECTIEGGGNELEIKWANKGAEFDPLDGLRGQTEDLRGQNNGAKGTSYLPTIHQEPSSRLITREGARSEGFNVLNTSEVKVLSCFTIEACDLQWKPWIDFLTTKARHDVIAAATASQRMTVFGSKWPKPDSPIPKAAKGEFSTLTETTKRITGDA